MAIHNILGTLGEVEAKKHLESKGYHIHEVNWRWNKAEVDIIAEIDNEVVIVEVKTRRNNYFGDPEEGVTLKKQNLLANAAEAYLQEKQLDKEIRFDIISVILNNKSQEIRHIESAFYPGLE